MVDLINANADAFSYARVIRPPIVEGLEFWNYYGGDSDMRRNLVPGKPAGIPAGDPTVGDFYIQCEGMTHYVQTAVPASNEFTFTMADEDGTAYSTKPVQPVPEGTGATTFGALERAQRLRTQQVRQQRGQG